MLKTFTYCTLEAFRMWKMAKKGFKFVNCVLDGLQPTCLMAIDYVLYKCTLVYQTFQAFGPIYLSQVNDKYSVQQSSKDYGQCSRSTATPIIQCTCQHVITFEPSLS